MLTYLFRPSILHRAYLLLIPGALLLLAAMYALTLQTQVSGSFQETTPEQILKNEYIKDVAEIQVALNVWGTIHHTGYPLFAILGNLFTIPLRAAGVEPAAAASLYALSWGMLLLGVFALLVWRLTDNLLVAAASAVLLGLARSIWIHNVIAEVYSMSLAIMVLLFLIALWPAPWRGAWSLQRRILALALLGGIGVAHHRAVVFITPGLLLAIGPHLWAARDTWRTLFPRAVVLGLIGFVPYFYLPLREWQGGDWVYGEPGTLRGFWIEFSGREAERLVRLPTSFAALGDNLESVWSILAHEISLPGLLAGLASLLIAVLVSPHRHAARTVALGAVGPALFATFYHTAVLPEAVLMPAVLALIFGVALTVDWLWQQQLFGMVSVVMVIGWAIALANWHYNDVRELVTEPSGINMIKRLDRLPRDSKTALTLPWGPHFAAAAYSRLVTGENRAVTMVDHKGNYRRLLAEGYRLMTEPDTFYTYPPPWPTSFGAPSDWWTERLGHLYLTSAAPGFIQLQNTPALIEPDESLGTPVIYSITRRAAWLTCDDNSIYLHVIWSADNRPAGDPSIFVHLTGDEPAPDPPNADSRHPVYGLYPFAQLSPGEIVRDDFTLPRLPDKTQVRFGLYEQDAGGQFINYGETVLPVAECTPEE